MSLWNCIRIEADYFREKRTNILMERASIPSSMGLSAAVRANVGKAKSHGVDASVDINKAFPSGWWVQGRMNFTYATSAFLEYEEPEYNEKYKSRIGNSLNQWYGLIAERLFIDEADGWTVLTDDGLPSAQWEHTFVMTESGPEILTY